MNFSVDVPYTDDDLIRELKGLPGARVVAVDNLRGKDFVRIAFVVTAVTGGVAQSAANLASTARSVKETLATVQSIFQRGIDRHRGDPNGEFKATLNNAPFVNSDMSDDAIRKNLDSLSK